MGTLYDNSRREFTVQKDCPWYEAQQTYGPPNVNWCEETQCAFINEPANTWSNLGFLIVGVWIYLRWKKSPLKYFGLIVVIMGLLSGIYHASNNFLTQMYDFAGMSLMMSYLLAFQCQRSFHNKIRFVFVFTGFLIANAVILYSLNAANKPVQMLMLINAVPLIAWDLFNGWKQKQLHLYSYFAAGFGSLLLAQIAAQIDLKRIYCEPQNLWFHGHVIWHILCAIAMFFIAIHMNRVRRS
jgi:hypothetical protein